MLGITRPTYILAFVQTVPINGKFMSYDEDNGVISVIIDTFISIFSGQGSTFNSSKGHCRGFTTDFSKGCGRGDDTTTYT